MTGSNAKAASVRFEQVTKVYGRDVVAVGDDVTISFAASGPVLIPAPQP